MNMNFVNIANFVEFLRTPFYIEHLWWLLLPFSVSCVRSAYNGTEGLSFLSPKVWDIVPTRLKEVTALSDFKSAIKKL